MTQGLGITAATFDIVHNTEPFGFTRTFKSLWTQAAPSFVVCRMKSELLRHRFWHMQFLIKMVPELVDIYFVTIMSKAVSNQVEHLKKKNNNNFKNWWLCEGEAMPKSCLSSLSSSSLLSLVLAEVYLSARRGERDMQSFQTSLTWVASFCLLPTLHTFGWIFH